MRRFFRFSLRTLLVAMTAVAVWLGLHVHAARRQAEAVRAVQDYGGFVAYDLATELPEVLIRTLGVDFFYPVTHVQLFSYSIDGVFYVSNGELSDPPLESLDAFPHLRSLSLYGDQITDDRLALISQHRSLQTLDLLDASQVTDKGLQQVGHLVNLERLDISGSQVTGWSFESLRPLERRKSLEVRNADLSDDSLRQKHGFPTRGR